MMTDRYEEYNLFSDRYEEYNLFLGVNGSNFCSVVDKGHTVHKRIEELLGCCADIPTYLPPN